MNKELLKNNGQKIEKSNQIDSTIQKSLLPQTTIEAPTLSNSSNLENRGLETFNTKIIQSNNAVSELFYELHLHRNHKKDTLIINHYRMLNVLFYSDIKQLTQIVNVYKQHPSSLYHFFEEPLCIEDFNCVPAELLIQKNCSTLMFAMHLGEEKFNLIFELYTIYEKLDHTNSLKMQKLFDYRLIFAAINLGGEIGNKILGLKNPFTEKLYRDTILTNSFSFDHAIHAKPDLKLKIISYYKQNTDLLSPCLSSLFIFTQTLRKENSTAKEIIDLYNQNPECLHKVLSNASTLIYAMAAQNTQKQSKILNLYTQNPDDLSLAIEESLINQTHFIEFLINEKKPQVILDIYSKYPEKIIAFFKDEHLKTIQGLDHEEHFLNLFIFVLFVLDENHLKTFINNLSSNLELKCQEYFFKALQEKASDLITHIQNNKDLYSIDKLRYIHSLLIEKEKIDQAQQLQNLIETP